MAMSSAGLTTEDLERMGHLMLSEEFRNRTILSRLREKAFATPEPTIEERLQALDKHPAWVRDAATMPSWTPPICRHRDQFQKTAFLISMPNGDEQALAFTYAVQSPQYVAATPLKRRAIFSEEEGVDFRNDM